MPEVVNPDEEHMKAIARALQGQGLGEDVFSSEGGGYLVDIEHDLELMGVKFPDTNGA